MSKILAFLQKHDWLGHIVEAIVISAVAAGIAYVSSGFRYYLTSLLVGGAFAAGHFHGREKRDYEVSVQMKPPHLEAYKTWLWNKDQLTDFLPVLAIYCIFFLYAIWS